MTEIEKENLKHELEGLKMELAFSNECGNNLVCTYIAQKESGETPSIDISAINTKRKEIIERMEEIEQELKKA